MGVNASTFQSAGKISQHYIPGAYSRIDSVKGARGLASANNGVVMGSCTGGQPATLLQFNTVAEAVNALRSGNLMEAVRLAFNPGNDYVPQRIFAMRVNTAVQGTVDLDESANVMILLTSAGYGLWVNQIRVIVATSTDTYGKKVTLKFQSNPDEVFDNIWQKSFTIRYTDAACDMTIVNKASAQTLVSSVGGLSIDLNDYTTIGELAAYINAQTDFTCVAIAGQENALTLELDAVVQDIYTADYDAESTMQAIIDTVTAGSALVVATAANAANDRAIPDNLAETYLTGGTEGTFTSSEWTAALLALEAEDIQFVSTPDSTAAVHAAIKTHCEAMSAVTGKKERQFIVGGPWADTVATAKAAAAVINSKYGMYIFNGGTARNNAAVITNFDASYVACMLMGMRCATAINVPLTFKTLNLIDVENKLTDSTLEDLIRNGTAPVNLNSNSLPFFVRQVTTYLTADLKWNEFSMVAEMLFASRDLRTYLEELFIGKPGTSLTGGVIRGAVEARLALYAELGIFIADPATGLSWWNVTITISGDTVTVDYDAYLTAPVNFIFVTNHFHELVASA